MQCNIGSQWNLIHQNNVICDWTSFELTCFDHTAVTVI